MDYIATKHGMSEVLNSIVGGTSDPSTVSHTPHSHSIVSSACKRLKNLEFPLRKFNFTVTLTVKTFCLAAIDPESTIYCAVNLPE